MAAKNSPAIVFDSKIVKKLFTLNEIELMVGKFGSIATRKSAFFSKNRTKVCLLKSDLSHKLSSIHFVTREPYTQNNVW